jgi:hypothetical protein
MGTLHVLQQLPCLKTLQLVIHSVPELDISAAYAFSTVASQLVENMSSLPYEHLSIKDTALPSLQMDCIPSSGQVIFHNSSSCTSAEGMTVFLHLPKWFCVAPIRLTQLSLHHVAVSNESMRVFFRMITSIRSICFKGCLVDLTANVEQTLHWAFLWERAIEAGEQLESAHVEECSYGRRENGHRSSITPLDDSIGLQLMVKEDAIALKKLERHLAEHAA